MKKLIFELAIISFLIMVCNSVSAVYNDSASLQLLMHCNETNHPNSWLLTPDDNSSGRNLNQPVLDRAATEWTVNTNTIPTLMSGSPKGGNYFRFDGTNDFIYVSPGWKNKQNIICDFSLRWLGYPSTNDDFVALIQTRQWRSYLRSADSNTCRVGFLFVDKWLYSDSHLSSDTWYDVHLSVVDNIATIIIDNTTNTTDVVLTNLSSQITIGNDIYRPTSTNRCFYGDIDEVRIGSLPGPAPHYDDSLLNQLLMHCDITNHPNSWLLSPDDNSSGRDLNQPVLDRALASWTNNSATVPALVTNDVRGGKYLLFDGIDDTVYVSPGWLFTSNLICDFSFKWLDAPPAEDPYTAIIQTRSWRFILRPDGYSCKLAFYYTKNDATEDKIFSDKKLLYDTWYDVHLSLIGGEAMFIIDNTTNTALITLTNISSQITIGNDIHRAGDGDPNNNRYFFGGIDEVRIGTIPEPVMFFLTGLLVAIYFKIRNHK